jgi:hypothetical protein
MVTHVSCINPKCSSYGVKKTVVSAEILGMNPKLCPECGGHAKVATQINTSSKGGGTKRLSSKRYSKKRGSKR